MVLIDGLFTQLVGDLHQDGLTADKVMDGWAYRIVTETKSNQNLYTPWTRLRISAGLTEIGDIATRLLTLVRLPNA